MQLDTAAEAIEALKNHGFRIVRDAEEPTHFDNASVDLKRGNVMARVIRERGQHFIELTSKRDPAEWFDASLILRLLNVRELAPYGVNSDAVATLAQHLVRIIDQIEDAFSRKQWLDTVERLRALRELRWQERLGSLTST